MAIFKNKEREAPKLDYWNAHKILTFNAMFMFIIGGRGLGKTYDAKKRCIKHAIKTGGRFIYLRRYMSEFETKETFFGDVSHEFEGLEFTVKGMTGYYRYALEGDSEDGGLAWTPICEFMSLSTAYTKKSGNYKDVFNIIFDEFIIEQGNIQYLKNEVRRFLDFYNTVDRFDDRVRVFFLANPISIVNPYFIYFKLRPRKSEERSTFLRGAKGYICVETITQEQFAKQVAATKFGQLIAGTAYDDYAIGGKYNDDTAKMIKPKTSAAEFRYGFKFDDRVIAVWVDIKEGYYYICSKAPKDAELFALTNSDHDVNMVMLNSSSPLLKNIIKLYQHGYVCFDDIATREMFLEVSGYLNLRA
jgi:hypothetical protein